MNMPITPQDYNGDAIRGEQLSKLMEKEIRDRLKGDVPETLAYALCVMAAEIYALKAALAASNIGTRIADSVDAQELKVGGVDVLTLGGDYAPKNHASTATTYGQSTTNNYGHAKLNNDTLNASSAGTEGVACSTGHKHSNLATSGAIGSGNQPVYFNADGYPTVIPSDPSYPDYLTLAVRTAMEAVSANSAGTAGTADRLSNTSAIGSGNRPVYFTASGVPAAIPYDSANQYLTLAVETAKNAVSANSAGTASRLANTGAVGSGNQPVYFSDQGLPTVVPFDATYSQYLTLAVLTAREANSAVTAGSASKLTNTSAIGSGNQPVYFDSRGVPVAVPFDSTHSSYLTLAVLTAREAVTAGSAGTATTATSATTASKLNASGGGTGQPVYFPSTGTDAGKPVPIPISTDPEIAAVGDFLTMQVQGAFYAHSARTAGSAAKATALDVSSAVGSSLQPVYINANGVPTPIEALSPPVTGHNYMVMEVTSAQYAASAGQAGSAGTAEVANSLPRSFINKESQTTKIWKKVATSRVFTNYDKGSITFLICGDGYSFTLGLESIVTISIETGIGGTLSAAYVGKYNFKNRCSVELLRIGSTNQYEIWVMDPLTDTGVQLVYLNSQGTWTIDSSNTKSNQKTDSEYSTYKSSNPSVASSYYHTYNIAKAPTSQTGSSSIPVYVNSAGEIVACTNINAATATAWANTRKFRIVDNSNANQGPQVDVNGGGDVNIQLPATIAANISGKASGLSAQSMLAGATYKVPVMSDQGDVRNGSALTYVVSTNMLSANISGNAATATSAQSINGKTIVVGPYAGAANTIYLD